MSDEILNEERAILTRLARESAYKIIEHCDAVMIIISATDGNGNTIYCTERKGNMHAVEGAVREFIRRTDSYEGGYHAELGRQDFKRHNNLD